MSEPPLLLSQIDCDVVARVERLANQIGRCGIGPEEMTDSFLTLLAFAESDTAVRQAVARLPRIVHPALKRQVTQLLATEHPGLLFVFKPHEPADGELVTLDARVQKIAAVLLRSIKTPEPVIPVTCEEVDRKSEFIAQCETVPDATCRTAGCCRPRVTHGVFCPEHHFEMLQQLGACSDVEGS